VYIEGVPYQRFVIRFTLADGRRRKWVRWAPYPQAMADALRREFHDRDVPIKPGSKVVFG